MYGIVKDLPYRSDGLRTSPGLRDRYLALTKRQPTLSADTYSPRGTLTLFLEQAQEVFDVTRSTQYVDRSDPKLHSLIAHGLQLSRPERSCLTTQEITMPARLQCV